MVLVERVLVLPLLVVRAVVLPLLVERVVVLPLLVVRAVVLPLLVVRAVVLLLFVERVVVTLVERCPPLFSLCTAPRLSVRTVRPLLRLPFCTTPLCSLRGVTLAVCVNPSLRACTLVLLSLRN